MDDLNEDEIAALTRIAGLIIPASDAHGVPGADDPAIMEGVLPRARRDPAAVRAALANLVENATEVSPEGEPVEVNIAVEDGEAVVSIVDGGPGLPESVRERLFSPHVTTKVGGSGMGLFLARQLVVGMHGGTLEIVDGPDGGTVATMRLPLLGEGASTGEPDLG